MTEIIAEIGQAHDGSLGILHSYIDAVAGTGAGAIKFQTHLADAESSPQEPFRVKFSRVDQTRQDYWRRMELSVAQWKELKAHCDEVGLAFLSSPFSIAAVDLLENIGIERFKIGSGEVSNFLLLERVARSGLPVLLSSGMSSLEELDRAVELLLSHGTPLTLLQCNTAYPTPPEQVGLNVMQVLRERYRLPVGLSDHTGSPYAAFAATALGAEVLEVHTVFDKRMFGPDASSSLTIDQLAQMVEGVRAINAMLSNPVDKNDNSRFLPLKAIFEKSLAVNADLPAGHRLRFEDLEAKKPAGMGIPASRFKDVLGCPLSVAKTKWDFLEVSDIIQEDQAS